jgi:hypothetical protein
MQVRLSTIDRGLTAMVFSFLLSSSVWPGQRAESSLTELDVESRELQVALDAVLGENKQLRDALSAAEASMVEMRKALAASSGEVEVFRRQALELKKRFEALGLNATSDPKKLEQRLLAATSDLQKAESEKGRLTEALVRLCEAVLRFSRSASSNDPDSRLLLEAEIRNANSALGIDGNEAPLGSPVPSTLQEASVISVREELALVVVNLGQKQGTRVGMPFQVIRGASVIGSVRVVDVREKFSGAVIQRLSSDNDRIKVGDRLRVDTQP